MRKTSEFPEGEKITVDVIRLQSMLGVGRNTAAQIGRDAGAVLSIGRRKLYNVEKVRRYMDELTED